MVNFKQAFLSTLFLFPVLAVAMNDKQVMSEARSQFANGNLKKSIELYTQITPQSDFWLESIEERAWGWTRLNEYENALADLQSITSPVWSTQVGPETYMLSSFVSLKMCDYKEVLNKINTFKKRMLFRVEALEKIEKQPLDAEFAKLIPAIKTSRLTLVDLGNKAEMFPRYFFRDKEVIKSLRTDDMTAVGQRMKMLAQNDLKEIETNLKKMKIIEVEMMQTVLMADKPKKNTGDLNFSKVDRNQKLIFPVTDDEVWMDEVGQYQVRAQKCAAKQKSVL